MRFDISALSGSLVEELAPLAHSLPTSSGSAAPVAATAEAASAISPASGAPLHPEPTKGLALTSDPDASTKDASLAVTWTLLVKSCCMTRNSDDWYLADRVSRWLYVFALVICVASCVVAALFPKTMFNPRQVHWFGWVVFSAFVLQEAIFLITRILVGRYKNLMQRPERGEDQTIGDTWRALISYKSFNTICQAWTTIFLQIESSAAIIIGTMFIIMQSDLTFDNDEIHTVRLEYRHSWRTCWLLAFAFVTIGICVCGWLDASRLHQVGDDAPHFSIELISWRIVLLTIIIPPLAVGWIVWCSVCCVGPLVIG